MLPPRRQSVRRLAVWIPDQPRLERGSRAQAGNCNSGAVDACRNLCGVCKRCDGRPGFDRRRAVWIPGLDQQRADLPSDFFSDKAVASVAGLGGTGAGIGSMIFIFSTGWVVDHFSYVPVLVVAGLLAPFGTLVLFALAGSIKRVPLKPSRRSSAS